MSWWNPFSRSEFPRTRGTPKASNGVLESGQVLSTLLKIRGDVEKDVSRLEKMLKGKERMTPPAVFGILRDMKFSLEGILGVLAAYKKEVRNSYFHRALEQTCTDVSSCVVEALDDVTRVLDTNRGMNLNELHLVVGVMKGTLIPAIDKCLSPGLVKKGA